MFFNVRLFLREILRNALQGSLYMCRLSDFYNKTQCYEDMCPSQLGDRNLNDADSDLWVKSGTNYIRTICYGFKHCSNTDLNVNTIIKEHCDYILMNRDKMEGRTWLTLNFSWSPLGSFDLPRYRGRSPRRNSVRSSQFRVIFFSC
jgi:hypothetical protein